jgi:hypothetical protein
MQENKFYQISYEYDEYDKVKRSQEVFSASAEDAKNRFEKFKQEHKDYTGIEFKMLLSSPNSIFEPLQKTIKE